MILKKESWNDLLLFGLCLVISVPRISAPAIVAEILSPCERLERKARSLCDGLIRLKQVRGAKIHDFKYGVRAGKKKE
ncbi:hypothetical protein [Leptospira levettii]|uniref:hypothetical protein n=1 Tax=Leptospira levettii TaxID=2023178 RepID=UPI00223E2F96|nr:hypothetical protein [Leptospira levettii]MCW7474575.1 hypothetical protein [Leptospira levettii]